MEDESLLQKLGITKENLTTKEAVIGEIRKLYKNCFMSYLFLGFGGSTIGVYGSHAIENGFQLKDINVLLVGVSSAAIGAYLDNKKKKRLKNIAETLADRFVKD